MTVKFLLAAILTTASVAAGIAGAATPPRHLAGTLAFTGESPLIPKSQVFLARPDGTITQLTHDPAGVSTNSWSPDGSRLLVYRFSPKGSEADVLNLDGSRGPRISTEVETQPRWSPDGKWIAFQHQRAIVVVGSNGRGGRRLAVNGTPSSLSGGLSWSPDSKRIAYVGMLRFRSALYVVPADGSGSATSIYAPKSGGPSGAPEWSTDGSEIAFTGPGGIFVVNPDGSGLKRLRAGRYYGPAWSPHSVLIAFVGPHANYLMRRDGTHVRRLPGCVCTGVYPGFQQILSWSPDGSKIAYSGGVGPHADGGIYYVNIDNTGATRVAYSRTLQYSRPIWRPEKH